MINLNLTQASTSTSSTYRFCGTLNELLLFRQKIRICLQVLLLRHSHFLFGQVSSYCESQCKQGSVLYLRALSLTTQYLCHSLTHARMHWNNGMFMTVIAPIKHKARERSDHLRFQWMLTNPEFPHSRILRSAESWFTSSISLTPHPLQVWMKGLSCLLPGTPRAFF